MHLVPHWKEDFYSKSTQDFEFATELWEWTAGISAADPPIDPASRQLFVSIQDLYNLENSDGVVSMPPETLRNNPKVDLLFRFMQDPLKIAPRMQQLYPFDAERFQIRACRTLDLYIHILYQSKKEHNLTEPHLMEVVTELTEALRKDPIVVQGLNANPREFGIFDSGMSEIHGMVFRHLIQVYSWIHDKCHVSLSMERFTGNVLKKFIVQFFEKHIFGTYIRNYLFFQSAYMALSDLPHVYGSKLEKKFNARAQFPELNVGHLSDLLKYYLKDDQDNNLRAHLQTYEKIILLISRNMDLLCTLKSGRSVGGISILRRALIFMEKNHKFYRMPLDGGTMLFRQVYRMLFNRIHQCCIVHLPQLQLNGRFAQLQILDDPTAAVDCFICMEPMQYLDYFLTCRKCSNHQMHAHLLCLLRFEKCAICKKSFLMPRRRANFVEAAG